MRLVVVGSVALDTIHTPSATHTDLLGGSAFYFSLAAAHFGPVGVVAIVGEDFPPRYLDLLVARAVDVTGVTRQPGATFRWAGRYEADPNVRHTLQTELGVFADFHPRLPATYAGTGAIFLANIDPDLQLEVLEQVRRPALVAADTMNLWIHTKPASVRRVIEQTDILLVNDEEAQLLTGSPHPNVAANRIREMGPAVVVVKKGAHGVVARGPWGWLLLPSYPVNVVQDATGAGDTFAGGLIGYLADKSWRERDRFAAGLALATSMASLVVEDFGVAGIEEDRRADIRQRCQELRDATQFDPPADI